MKFIVIIELMVPGILDSPTWMGTVEAPTAAAAERLVDRLLDRPGSIDVFLTPAVREAITRHDFPELAGASPRELFRALELVWLPRAIVPVESLPGLADSIHHAELTCASIAAAAEH